MIWNYLISSIRSLLKDRLYVVINTLGLSIGIATCLFIYQWVLIETSYDTLLPDSDRIFRVTTQWKNAEEEGMATTYPMVKKFILDEFPEAERSVRLFKADLLSTKKTISYNDKIFNDDELFYADPSFFRVFGYHLLKGDSETVLKKPNAVVLTSRTAIKYFGAEDPVGKVIILGDNKELEVTGIMENIPENTHFNFDLVASMESHSWVRQAENSVWSGLVFYSYVKLKDKNQAAAYQVKITNLINHLPDDPKGFGKGMELPLQPIQKIHLNSALKFECGLNGDIKYVYIFSSIAFLVLIIASINYINLASARYTRRTKEVGIRKVMGARRSQLMMQFISESILITCGALLFSLLLLRLMSPQLTQLTDQNPGIKELWNPVTLLVALSGTIVLGFLTGAFPAFVISSLRPSSILKPDMNTGASGPFTRRVLIAFQFAISILLTSCTLIVYQQLRFIGHVKLGYDKDHIIVMHIGNTKLMDHYHTLKSELQKQSYILGTSAVSQLPTNVLEGEGINFGAERYEMNYMGVDRDFFATMGITVLEGRELIAQIEPTDTTNHFVLNESAVKQLGWEPGNVLMKKLIIRHGDMLPGSVIGIVSDFHFQSLHQPVGPIVMEFKPYEYQFLLVRVSPGAEKDAMVLLKNTWKDLAGAYPVDYSFLDQDYDKLYRSERRSSNLFNAFSLIAISLALLGLFALSAFSVERRRKEIGIRKVLGATTASIIGLLSKEFMFLQFFSLIIAIPVCYYFMDNWLSDFAYKISIGVWVFLLAGSLNILLAWITVGYQGLKAARANPGETLKSE